MISYLSAACVYHPARTMSLLHGVEFDGQQSGLTRNLPGEIITDLQVFADREAPLWDPWLACHDLECAHRDFLDNGCVLVDLEAIPLQDIDNTTLLADLIPQFTSSYIHFGRSGPSSPWQGIHVEGCYLDYCPYSRAISLTFACSSPFSARMDEVPTSVGILHQARCIQVSVDCSQSVNGAIAAALADRDTWNSAAWSDHVGSAIRYLAAALLHIAEAPSGMRFDYPDKVPRVLANKVFNGSEEEAGNAAEILLANYFMAVVFYGESMASEPMTSA